jgi:type I restriction enzyme S subunit
VKVEIRKIKEIAQIQTGKYDVNHSSINGKFTFYTCAMKPFKSDTYSFEGESIILPGNGANVGQVFFSENHKFEAYQRTYVINKIQAYPKYVFYYFKSNWTKSLKNKQYGSATNYIRYDNIAKFDIPLPLLNDQVLITGILSRAEGLIEKRKESIRLLDEFLKSTFLEMFGDPVRNEKGWDVVNLEDLCQTIVDCPHSTPIYSDSHVGYYCIRSSDIQDFRINLSKTKEVPENIYNDRIKRHIPKAGEVVYTREGGRLGFAAILPKNLNICLGQRMMLFIADLEQSTNIYIWSLLNSDSVRKKILKMAGGGAAPRVNIKDLKQIKVIKPFLKRQIDYSEKIKKIESLRIKYQTSLEDLENLSGSLSQRAFKGELDLSRVPMERAVINTG